MTNYMERLDILIEGNTDKQKELKKGISDIFKVLGYDQMAKEVLQITSKQDFKKYCNAAKNMAIKSKLDKIKINQFKNKIDTLIRMYPEN